MKHNTWGTQNVGTGLEYYFVSYSFNNAPSAHWRRGNGKKKKSLANHAYQNDNKNVKTLQKEKE